MTESLNQLRGITMALSPEGAVDEMIGRHYDEYTARFTDIGTASGAQTEETILKLDANRYPNGARLVAAYWGPAVAVTADDTNYKTLTVRKMTSAGGSATTIASSTTKITGGTGDLAANQLAAATVTTASDANILAAGSLITYVIGLDAGNTGVAMNASTAVTKGNSRVVVVLEAL